MASSEDLLQSRVIVRRRAGSTEPGASRGSALASESAPTPAPSAKHAVESGRTPTSVRPTKIGRFSVLEPIGQGGMGVVYGCYDDQLDRKVAVKVMLRRLVGSEQGQIRLLREAQAMARLSHPNIVTVLEAGSFDDQVYLAMEFVRGVTLDRWVSESDHAWPEIVEAFIQAGRGLAAAHRAGIVHRDFKPQNVIITEDRAVKVLDFGLAKVSTDDVQHEAPPVAAGSERESHSLLTLPLTRAGAFLGTPAYMSPEQHFGGSVTAASDQFSFCVALYQSLYGYMPFPVDSLQALREAVAQGRMAPIPPRTAVPGQVSRAIRRGLAALPEQRFPSMSELLVELGRDSTARRRRIAVTAVVAAVVGAAGFVAAGSLAPASAQVCPDAQAELTRIWNPARANTVHSAFLATGLPHAEESWATIEPQLTRFAGAWGTMRNEACQTHAEGRQSDQLFDLRTVCLDQRRAGFAAIVDILTSTEATTLDRDIQAVGRLPSLAPCADTEALTAAMAPPEDAATRTRVNALRERLAQAQAEEHAGRYPLGLELVGKVLEEARTLGYEPLLAEALLRQGSLQAEAGADAAAEAALDLALASAVQSEHKQVAAQASSKRLWVRGHRLGRPLEALKEAHLVTAFNARIESDVDVYAEFLGNIGYVYFVGGNIPEAERSLRGALARLEAHGRGESALALKILNDLAFVAKDARVDYKEALTLSRRVTALSRTLLGEHHPAHLHHVATEVNILISVGRPNEARALLGPLEQRLEMIADPRLKAYVLLLLGYIAREERDFDTAHRYLGAVLELAPEHSEESVGARLDLGLVKALSGSARDEAEIRIYFDDALARIQRQFGSEHLAYQAAQRYYGEALCALGRPEAARRLFNAVMPRDESDAQSDERRIVRAGIQQHLGVAYHKLGDLESARRELTQALDVYEQLATPGYMSTAELRRHLGEIAISEGRFDEALVLLRQSEGVYSAHSESDYWPLALTRFDLARALTGPAPVVPEAARRLALAALAVLEAKGANFKPEFDIVAAWVREHVER